MGGDTLSGVGVRIRVRVRVKIRVRVRVKIRVTLSHLLRGCHSGQASARRCIQEMVRHAATMRLVRVRTG